MNRATVLNELQQHEAELSRRFGVVSLTLFGSFARDQATEQSDVDVLVSFDNPPDWRSLFGAQSYLEDLFGRPVDLVVKEQLREEVRPYVERDISMPDSPSGAREWRFYIQDMIGFCENVLSYTHGLDQAAFLADRRTYDATLRNIEMIGEAANHIPDDVREAHPDIAWGAIVGMRNRLAHAYLSISDSAIWSAIQNDIPATLPLLRNILESPDEESR